MSAFASFSNTKYFQRFLSSSDLNRLNALSPYQKFVQIGIAQILRSGLIKQGYVEINTEPQHN